MARVLVACIKQVPATTEIKVDPETNTLIREGVETMTNPFDMYALEEALRLKERLIEGRVFEDEIKTIAISMGPPQAEQSLREALSLGIDSAVLLTDRKFAGADTLATARTLARAIRKISEIYGRPLLVICGRQTIDGDTAQVGPELAHFLGFPFVAYVSFVLEIGKRKAVVKRLMDDRYQEIEAPLPLVISVNKDINTPRVPSLKSAIRARTAEIPRWDAQFLGLSEDEIGLAGSATQVIKVFVPKHEKRTIMLEGLPEEQAAKLISHLRAMQLI